MSIRDRVLVCELGGLAETDEHDAPELHPLRREHVDACSLLAFEGRDLGRLGQEPLGLLVEVLRGGGELGALLGKHDGDTVGGVGRTGKGQGGLIGHGKLPLMCDAARLQSADQMYTDDGRPRAPWCSFATAAGNMSTYLSPAQRESNLFQMAEIPPSWTGQNHNWFQPLDAFRRAPHGAGARTTRGTSEKGHDTLQPIHVSAGGECVSRHAADADGHRLARYSIERARSYHVAGSGPGAVLPDDDAQPAEPHDPDRAECGAHGGALHPRPHAVSYTHL